MKKYILLIALFALAFSACRKTDKFDPVKQAAKDEEQIKKFVFDNKIDAVRDSSGLYYYISEQGTGTIPTTLNSITVDYQGRVMTSGLIFDDREDVKINFETAIAGWQNGLKHLNSGGDIILFIPSALAYGNRQFGVIPPNSVLVFTIHLDAVGLKD